MLGAKESAVRKALQSTCTLALLQSFAAAGPTRYDAFIASHNLEPDDGDTSEHSLQCDEFEPDPKHRNAMLKTPLAPHWIKSEHSEMEGLFKRGALRRVLRSSLAPDDIVFSSRFHYKIKRHIDMSLNKLKVRLVLQGQFMKQGRDYEHSFSPVPHASGFRLMLALATAEDMYIDHVDISQAFVQGDLIEGDRRIFMTAPPGYDEDPAYVYELLKPLYGAPSSSRAWHKTMSGFMREEGFSTVGFEKSMWFRERDGERLLVGAHIDDFIICGSSRDAVDSFRLALLNRFEGTYEGVLHHYLGCAVTRDLAAGTTFLSQAHYAEHTLKQLDMWDCTPVKTPLPPGARLSIDDCAVGYIDPEFHAKYRRIVGCLGWLVGMTRPDLSWTYASLARFVAFPGQVHMDAAVHALAYLRGTYDKGLLYCRTPGIDHNRLWGWVDADYAGCQDTRKSHTGYVLMLNGAAISWKSKRQASVSLSSAESEFIAASQCGQEIVYLREILRGFHAPQREATILYEDNRACIDMSENQVHRERSRHIDVRKYYVRDLVEDKVLKLHPCPTADMVADALTKSLPYPAFSRHYAKMTGETRCTAASAEAEVCMLRQGKWV